MRRIGSRRWNRSSFELTERQQQVLRLIERGYSNSEIADVLGMTLDGAKFHVSEILAKLQVSTREDAVLAWKASPARLPWTAWVALTGAAVAVVAAGIVVFGLIGSGDEEASGALPAETATAGAAFTCPPPRTPTPTLALGVTPTPKPPVDGPQSVVFNGRRYIFALSSQQRAVQPMPSGLIGPMFGEVCFNYLPNYPAPDYVERDGDGFGVEPGTEVFTVRGYSPNFRLAVRIGGKDLFFEALPLEGGTASDVLDLRGKVARLNLYQTTEATIPNEVLVGSTSDPATIAELVILLLDSPVRQLPTGRAIDAYIRLDFEMLDGSAVLRGYYPDAGFVERFDVPPQFDAEIARLIAAGP